LVLGVQVVVLVLAAILYLIPYLQEEAAQMVLYPTTTAALVLVMETLEVRLLEVQHLQNAVVVVVVQAVRAEVGLPRLMAALAQDLPFLAHT
jgi:hypothetical protein